MCASVDLIWAVAGQAENVILASTGPAGFVVEQRNVYDKRYALISANVDTRIGTKSCACNEGKFLAHFEG